MSQGVAMRASGPLVPILMGLMLVSCLAVAGRKSRPMAFRKLRRFLYENALSLVLFAVAALCLGGMSVAGQHTYNEELRDHGEAPLGYLAYLVSGHFIESVFENWESEFLQMAAFVLLTIKLRQKGSSESKPFPGEEKEREKEKEEQQRPRPLEKVPWPVRRGGLWLKLYENSLSASLLLLFFLSFALHIEGGLREYNGEQLRHGQQPVGAAAYLASSRFWFESLQNWQSEFLSIGALCVLSIFLRQKGSPQSKEMEAPHDETGD
jgi:hypothetical protein